LIYLVIIAVTYCAVLYLRNPELLKEVWLWIIGLFGIVAAYFETLWKSLKANLFPAAAPAKNSTKITTDLKPSAPALVSITAKSPIESVKIPATPIENKLSEQIALLEKKIVDQDKYIDTLESKAAQVEKTKRLQEVTFTGTTLTLLRFIDDGETTLGLLYLDGNSFATRWRILLGKKRFQGKQESPLVLMPYCLIRISRSLPRNTERARTPKVGLHGTFICRTCPGSKAFTSILEKIPNGQKGAFLLATTCIQKVGEKNF